MAKEYKNVYTILEKVKKGEIDTYYKDRDGLFGRINFYQKPDLIKPHLHYLDESKIENIFDTYMNDKSIIKENFQKFQKLSDYKSLADDQKPNFDSYNQRFVENYENFPAHIGKDIFKMFYNKMTKLDFEERTDKNYSQFKILERSNNPVAKIMTENSNLRSAIYARNLISYFVTRMTMMEYIDPNACEDLKNSLEGKSEFDNENIDKILETMCDSRSGKNMLEDSLQKAKEACDSINNTMSEELQEQMFDAAADDKEAGKLSPDYIQTVTRNLEKVSMSLNTLKNKIKKLLDKSISYFSSKKITKYEDLFSSDNLGGLEDYELLHPKLRKLFVEDLQVKDSKSIGKINIYIDVSGSMGSDCGVRNVKGETISKIDFAKSFVAMLKKNDLLDQVYIFDGRVRNYKSDVISIAMLGCNGGTCLDNVIDHINRDTKNALIITDAEDRCNKYSDKAFVVGVAGSDFTYFEESVLEQYVENDQLVVFDGSKISKVNKFGAVI